MTRLRHTTPRITRGQRITKRWSRKHTQSSLAQGMQASPTFTRTWLTSQWVHLRVKSSLHHTSRTSMVSRSCHDSSQSIPIKSTPWATNRLITTNSSWQMIKPQQVSWGTREMSIGMALVSGKIVAWCKVKLKFLRMLNCSSRLRVGGSGFLGII